MALQCKAAGSPPPRITWLKGDRPLGLSERHHFTPGSQLLVVQNVVAEDAGQYTCEMSNALGTERAHSQLSVLPSPGCRKDGTTVGIFTIAVVCSVVLTSLVWVCIIYQTRKKSEEYSVTNTGYCCRPRCVWGRKAVPFGKEAGCRGWFRDFGVFKAEDLGERGAILDS